MTDAALIHSTPRVAYCTMFDSGYLSRGLALIDSMRSSAIDDPIWILCLDEITRRYLDDLALPGVHTIRQTDLEEQTEGLREAGTTRSRVEYFFTCTPALVCAVLGKATDTDWVIYIDADMWFYANPAGVFAEMGSGQIGIVPHRFPDSLRTLEKYGLYNVAWVMFGNSDEGRECAAWWRESCIDWCFDHPEGGRYADQGYLDEFQQRFPSTVVINDPGINVAPWNLGRHGLSIDDNARVQVDGRPLVFYHFHGLRKKGDWIYPNLATYRATLDPIARDHLYRPYIATLDAIERGGAAVNFGKPLPLAPPQGTTRNQRSLRSAAYRARRRVVQFRERRAGGAFRITDFDEDSMSDRRYGRS